MYNYNVISAGLFKPYSTNTTNIQIKVTGWKKIILSHTSFRLYVNGLSRTCVLVGTNFSSNANSSEYAIATLPSNYRPIEGTITLATFSGVHTMMRTDGLNINIYNANKTANGISCTGTYNY